MIQEKRGLLTNYVLRNGIYNLRVSGVPARTLFLIAMVS